MGSSAKGTHAVKHLLTFPAIAVLPPRTKITVAYFCTSVIPKTVKGMAFDLANSLVQLMLHMDNATAR
jgi:hypothetical protein